MNPKIIMNDLGASMKTYIRSPGTLFWSFAFPVMLILIFGAIFSGMGESYSLYVQDLDNSMGSREFLENINYTGVIDIKMIPLQEDLDAYIKDNRLKAVLIIPEGFGKTVWEAKQGDNVSMNLTLKLDPSQQTTNSIIETVMSNSIQGLNLWIADGKQIIELERESVITKRYEFIDFFIPGIIGMSIMTSGIYGSIERNTKFKKDGILRKLSTTPITRAEWVLSKMLFMVFLAFISTAMIILVGVLVFGVSIQINLWALIIIISGSLAFSGLGMIVTRFVTEEETADSAAGAITFPMMFLAGTFFPLEMMPPFLQAIAKILPLYYVNEGLRDAMILGDASGALWNSIIVLIFTAVVFTLGVLLTSWKEE